MLSTKYQLAKSTDWDFDRYTKDHTLNGHNNSSLIADLMLEAYNNCSREEGMFILSLTREIFESWTEQEWSFLRKGKFSEAQRHHVQSFEEYTIVHKLHGFSTVVVSFSFGGVFFYSQGPATGANWNDCARSAQRSSSRRRVFRARESTGTSGRAWGKI